MGVTVVSDATERYLERVAAQDARRAAGAAPGALDLGSGGGL